MELGCSQYFNTHSGHHALINVQFNISRFQRYLAWYDLKQRKQGHLDIWEAEKSYLPFLYSEILLLKNLAVIKVFVVISWLTDQLISQS